MLKRTVIKIGGSLLEDPGAVERTASMIIREYTPEIQLVVVVSALKGETNRLKKLATDNFPHVFSQELDLLMASGEQAACALMTTALKNLGRSAISMIAHQIPIVTNNKHEDARIISVEKNRILRYLDEGNIVVVAGFQGVDENLNVTTLGRGGSDLTAVAIAAAIAADVCRLYKDAGGIFSADIRIPGIKAIKRHTFSIDELIELTSSGAKIVHSRAAIMAKIYKVKLEIVPESEDEIRGTAIIEEEEMDPTEKHVVTAITGITNEMKVSIFGVPNEPKVAGKIFKTLENQGVNVNMIIQNISQTPRSDLTFTAPLEQKEQIEKAMAIVAKNTVLSSISFNEDIATISLVGAGMKSNSGVAADCFTLLGEQNININGISTSEIKISMIIEKKRCDEAIRLLHKHFIG